MKTLWAPWRMKFVKSIKKNRKNKKCILCNKVKELNDKKNYVLYRGKKSFIILNLYPYSNGHLMVAPNRHIAELDKLSSEEIIELMDLVNLSIKLLKKTHNPDGFNIGINYGKAAGAGIDKHIHIHIVPRWFGDVNFMPVISDTKIIPESLDSTYQKLKKELQ